MDKIRIMEELDKISLAPFTHKTDYQLWSYEKLSQLYKFRNTGKQPEALKKFNSTENRKCKLTVMLAEEIRKKYIPHVYGKQKLAKEYGVSTTVIFRILKGRSWKNTIW